MRRESSGRIAESVCTLRAFEWPEPGPTVGKSPDGFDGVVYEPSGSDPPGSEKPDPGRLGRVDVPNVDEDEDDEDDEVAETMVTVALAWSESAPVAFTVAVRVTFDPDATAEVVSAPATSSELCPVGRLPRSQTSPFADGQTANVGASTSVTLLTVTVRVVPVLAALVVHTNTAKLAVPPGGTLLLRYASTDTHSCGVGGGGLGEGVLGLGEGVVGVGDGVVGAVVLGVFVGVGLSPVEVVGIGVLPGVGLPVGVSLGSEDGVTPVVRLGVLVPDGLALEAGLEGLALADRLGDADDVGLLTSSEFVAVLACDESVLVVAVGRVAHGLEALSRTPGFEGETLVPATVVTTASTTRRPSAAIWARLSISSARSRPARRGPDRSCPACLIR
jgi:hypothetical protein